MIKAVKDMNSIKNAIKTLQGEDVFVKVNLGRNKFETYQGQLTSVYPSLFAVTPYGGYEGKTVFSYAELICGNVKIKPKNLNKV